MPDTKDIHVDILGVRDIHVDIHMDSSTWEAGGSSLGSDRSNGERRLIDTVSHKSSVLLYFLISARYRLPIWDRHRRVGSRHVLLLGRLFPVKEDEAFEEDI